VRRTSSEIEEQEKSVIEREISERSVDEERERMTPAFNSRVRADSNQPGAAPHSSFKIASVLAAANQQMDAMNHTLSGP
jgi:mevalonate pyrophosphate decarboxylase